MSKIQLTPVGSNVAQLPPRDSDEWVTFDSDDSEDLSRWLRADKVRWRVAPWVAMVDEADSQKEGRK